MRRCLSYVLFLFLTFSAWAQEIDRSFADTLVQVLVTADKVAISVKGDTTVIHTGQFVSLKGDSLRDLIKSVPGLSVSSSGCVIANGVKVEKILVNGKPLFLGDVKSALDVLEPEMMKEIRIYDQRNQLDYTHDDGNDNAERVIDVITKDRLDKISSLSMSLSGGYPSELSAGLACQAFELNRPSTSLDVSYGKNNRSISYSPSDKVLLASLFGENKSSSYILLNNSLSLDCNSQKVENHSEKNYTVDERIDVSNGRLSDRYLKIADCFTFSKTLPNRRDKLETTCVLNYNWIDSYNVSELCAHAASGDLYSCVSTGKNDHGFSLSLREDWLHKFVKKGRVIKASIHASSGFGSKKSFHLDTLGRSLSSFNYQIKNAAHEYSLGGIIVFKEPVSRHFSLGVDASAQYFKKNSSCRSFDVIRNTQDMFNSYLLKADEQVIKAGIYTECRFKTVSAKLAVVYSGFGRQLQDKCSPVGQNNHFWHIISPEMNIDLRFPRFMSSLSYNEIPVLPNVIDTRFALDTRSNIYFTAGNPVLTPELHRNLNFNASYTALELQTIFGFTASIKMTSDCVVNRLTIFAENTYYPDYDFTFPAGTTLSVPVNSELSYNVRTSVNARIRSLPLKSTFTPSLTVIVSATPVLYGDIGFDNSTYTIGCGLSYISSFSRKYALDINSSFNYSRSFSDSRFLFSSMAVSTESSLRANPFAGLWIIPSYRCDISFVDNGSRLMNLNHLDLSVSYRFGRKFTYEVGIQGHNLLNDGRSEVMSVADVFISRVSDNLLGRSFVLFGRIRFK